MLRRLADEAATVALVGFSLGGNLTLKLLGEPLDGIPVAAGAAISAPLDLALGTAAPEQGHLRGVRAVSDRQNAPRRYPLRLGGHR